MREFVRHRGQSRSREDSGFGCGVNGCFRQPAKFGGMGKWRGGHPPSRELGRGSARYPDTSHNGQLLMTPGLLPALLVLKLSLLIIFSGSLVL